MLLKLNPRKEGRAVTHRRYKVMKSPIDFVHAAHIALFTRRDLVVRTQEEPDELMLRRKEEPAVELTAFTIMAIHRGDDPNHTLIDAQKKSSGNYVMFVASQHDVTFELIS